MFICDQILQYLPSKHIQKPSTQYPLLCEYPVPWLCLACFSASWLLSFLCMYLNLLYSDTGMFRVMTITSDREHSFCSNTPNSRSHLSSLAERGLLVWDAHGYHSASLPSQFQNLKHFIAHTKSTTVTGVFFLSRVLLSIPSFVLSSLSLLLT